MPRSRDTSKPTPLADHLAWLESIGARPCICRYAWKSLSWREGSGGYGWIRMNTDRDCQEHGSSRAKITP